MVGCVLIHGFTGSPNEIKPLAVHLKKRGIKVWCPTLPGHGHDHHRIKEVRWQDWVERAENTVRHAVKTCRTVYLVGFSMGGMIAAYLATRYPVKKLVLLNAAVYYINPQQFVKDIGDMVQRFIKHPIRSTLKGSWPESHRWKRYKQKVKETPMHAVIQFQLLVHHLRPHLRRVKVPVLIIQGAKDELIHPKSPYYIYNHISSKNKEICIFPESRHLICLDREQNKVIARVEQFFGLHRGSHAM